RVPSPRAVHPPDHQGNLPPVLPSPQQASRPVHQR
ncbi:hypothetical protein BN1708_019806, partial [Verticillium longisporum]